MTKRSPWGFLHHCVLYCIASWSHFVFFCDGIVPGEHNCDKNPNQFFVQNNGAASNKFGESMLHQCRTLVRIPILSAAVVHLF